MTVDREKVAKFADHIEENKWLEVCDECGVLEVVACDGYVKIDVLTGEKIGFEEADPTRTLCPHCWFEDRSLYGIREIAKFLANYIKEHPDSEFERELLKELVRRGLVEEKEIVAELI